MLDEKEFLSPFGIRALSRCHAEHPYIFNAGGQEFRVNYLQSGLLFGANMQICRRFLLAVTSCVALAICGAAQEHTPHVWDYGDTNGPTHWGDLKQEFATCKTGHRQSPIDIRAARSADLPPIRFDYRPSPLRIIDNGHTIMVTYSPGSFISVGSDKYELKQVHFHRPSEEKIDGKSSAMVAHLVHSGENGRLVVVAVLLEEGNDNPLIGELWKVLPKEKEKEELIDSIQIDATRILPADRSYYTYSGSLTTPPCTEGVTWFVLKHPVTVSASQIEQFSELYSNNARPTQPVRDRVVSQTK